MRNAIAIVLFLSSTAVLAADPPPPPKPWNSSLGAGLALTSGNTDTKNYNLSFATKYDPKTKFVFKADALYLRDPFKDIDYFVAPLAGGGYRIIKSDTRNLTVDGAVGSVIESGSAGRTSGGALKAGENFDWALSATSKLTQKLTGIWKTSDFGDALYHFDAGLTTRVATRIELTLAYNYDYKNKPASASVKKGDSALFAALLYKF